MAKTAEATTAPDDAPKIVQLRRLEEVTVPILVEGVTPVIPHRWSQKSIRMMADKQQQTGKGTVRKREPKNPDQEAEDSCYWLPSLEGDGKDPALPAVSFKAAMVGACRFFEGMTMTQAKLLFYVEGEGPDQLVRLTFGEQVRREDTPRNAGGVPDLRYRYAFHPWSATVRVRYMPSMIDASSVVTLLDAAGHGGVGDWRPSSPKSTTGTFGQFRVSGEES
jgi:hypothetical protein